MISVKVAMTTPSMRALSTIHSSIRQCHNNNKIKYQTDGYCDIEVIITVNIAVIYAHNHGHIHNFALYHDEVAHQSI